MKNWLKENWFRVIIISVLICLVVSWIFFVLVSPRMIKRYCTRRLYLESNTSYSLDIRKELYTVCLHKYGL